MVHKPIENSTFDEDMLDLDPLICHYKQLPCDWRSQDIHSHKRVQLFIEPMDSGAVHITFSGEGFIIHKLIGRV